MDTKSSFLRYKYINKINILVLLLFTISSFGQSRVYYPEFDYYRDWSYGTSFYIFDKEKIDVQYGDHLYTPLYTNGFSFFTRKTFAKSKPFSFVTGIGVNITGMGNFKFIVRENNILESDFYDIEMDNYEQTRRINFSVPLLLQYKIPVNDAVFLNIESGFEILYRENGSESYGLSVTDPANGRSRDLVYYIMENVSETSIYPSYILSTGIFWMFRTFMLQTNIVYQKTLKNHYKGEARFFNMLESPDTYMITKKTGDYLGMSLQFYFKK